MDVRTYQEEKKKSDILKEERTKKLMFYEYQNILRVRDFRPLKLREDYLSLNIEDPKKLS